MSLTGQPPLPGYYCPSCGEVRRETRPHDPNRQVRVNKAHDVVVVLAHTRNLAVQALKQSCPGGRASRTADRAP